MRAKNVQKLLRAEHLPNLAGYVLQHVLVPGLRPGLKYVQYLLLVPARVSELLDWVHDYLLFYFCYPPLDIEQCLVLLQQLSLELLRI